MAIRSGMRQLGVQEVDIVSIVKPITKYAVTVLDPKDIRYHMEKAAYLAIHGRPGPVWIDIPLDVQASPIDDPDKLRSFDPAELEPTVANANLQQEVSTLIEKLNQAERPLLFAGNGIRLARAVADSKSFVICSRFQPWLPGVPPTWFPAMSLRSLDAPDQ